MRAPSTGLGAAGVAILLALVVAACAEPAASFSGEGPCTVDGRAPGGYPDLEARLPASLAGIGPQDGSGPASSGGSTTAGLQPTSVDSGRNCTQKVLGTLWDRGVRELRFAGAIWDLGGGDGVVSAVFLIPPGQPALDSAWIEEFYEVSARASSKAENVTVTRPTIDPVGEVFRLDTLNDLSLQTVVVWPDGDVTRAVIVATTVQPGADRANHERTVALAVEQSASRASG